MYTPHPSPGLPVASLLRTTAAAQEQSWQHKPPEPSEAFSPAHGIAHTPKGLCHSQSGILAQGHQQVLGNVESIRWRTAQNVRDKTNLHKTVKTKKAGNRSMAKNYSLYPDAILSSTLSSFPFHLFASVQPNPPTLCCAAFKSGYLLMMPGYQIWITVRTQDSLSLCSSSDAWFSKPCWQPRLGFRKPFNNSSQLLFSADVSWKKGV